ncbi:MAG: hypothetical protein H7839_01125 [Magnetococcus sp. YQC-5]
MLKNRVTMFSSPFNTPVETGLRVLSILSAAYPKPFDLHHLSYLDYLLVHSNDIPDGPDSLHPPTPYRSGEILVRRSLIEQGLLLFWSRGLVDRHFTEEGIIYAGTNSSGTFLDSLYTMYVKNLREHANWLLNRLGDLPKEQIQMMVEKNMDKWGSECTFESIFIEESIS